MNYKNTLAILIILAAFSCKSPIEILKKYQGAIITIGSGGGFSGEYNEYLLLENGNIYHKNSLKKDTIFIGSLMKNEMDQIFRNYKILGLNNKTLNNPGNFNYFIKFDKDSTKHKLQWSNSSHIDKNIKLFYNLIMSKIKDLTTK